jgi:hypothetical protein
MKYEYKGIFRIVTDKSLQSTLKYSAYKNLKGKNASLV